jgi:hypothetical protein
MNQEQQLMQADQPQYNYGQPSINYQYQAQPPQGYGEVQNLQQQPGQQQQQQWGPPGGQNPYPNV